MKIFFTILFTILFYFNSFSQNSNHIYYNKTISPLTLKEKQKPLIFVDFWATWCAPCVASMPHTQHLQDLYGGDVLFVYVNNEPSNKTKTFLERKKFTLNALVDNKRKSIDEFGIVAIPRSFLLDSKGNVLWTGKPTEMTKSLLESYIYNYNEQGDAKRFVKYSMGDENENWKKYDYHIGLKYIKSDKIVDEVYEHTDDSFYVSGSFNYIVSYAFDIPLNHIVNQFSDKYFKFTCINDNEDVFKQAIKSFLKANYHFKIKRENKKQLVYKVKETGTEDFMSNQLYNYEKGDAQYIQTDYSIQIDNATIKQMLDILTKLTPYTFIYTGSNKKVFDWSITFTDKDMLLQQLRDELDFKIKEKERKVSYYKVVRK